MDDFDAAARAEIQARWDVFDADGEQVGRVAEVRAEGFLLETSVGQTLEIDYRDVESADDGRVELVMSGDELTSDLDV